MADSNEGEDSLPSVEAEPGVGDTLQAESTLPGSDPTAASAPVEPPTGGGEGSGAGPAEAPPPPAPQGRRAYKVVGPGSIWARGRMHGPGHTVQLPENHDLGDSVELVESD